MKIYTLPYRYGISDANWKSWGSDKSDAWKIHMKIKFGRRTKKKKHSNTTWWIKFDVRVGCVARSHYVRTSLRFHFLSLARRNVLNGFFFFWFIRWYWKKSTVFFYFGRLIIIIKCVHVHNVRSTILPDVYFVRLHSLYAPDFWMSQKLSTTKKSV